MSDARRPTPEERYLEKKLAELATLQSQLADRELELHTVRGGLFAFEKQYEAAVSSRYEQLDEIKFQIAQRVTRPAEPQVNQEPKPSDAKPAAPNRPRSRPPAAKPAPKPPEKPPQFNPAQELKKLYRDVAKMIHPDLADSEEGRAHRHQFMTRVNEAYEAGDHPKLLGVLQEWEHSPESVQGIGPGADLIRVIRKIEWSERRLVAITEEMEQLQTSGLFGMKVMSEEAAQFERDLMSEMTSRLDAEIEAAKAYLARLEAAEPQADRSAS